MPKIKILFTIPNFKTAGSQYVLLALYKGLDKNVFDPYVCVERFPESIPADIPTDRRLTFAFQGNTKSELFRFKKLLKNHQIQLVHSWDYKSNFWEALACRWSGVKYIYTKKNNAWSKRWFLKSVLANHIAYDNPEMKERFFKSLLFNNKITFIPHGVDTGKFRPVEKQTGAHFHIGCIGMIGENKNQLFLVNILKRLPENTILHFYGNEEPEYRNRLDKTIKEQNLSQRVHFHGFVANRQVPEILAGLNIFVLASIQEGLPVSILEAMACGIPILSSDSGGGARYLLSSDFIFSLDNPDEFVAKFLNIYHWSAKQEEKILLSLRGKVVANHTEEGEVAAYDSLYSYLFK